MNATNADRRSFLVGAGLGGALAACAGSESPPPSARHVVLLGDSIFDNARYVPGEPAVIDQLRAELVSPDTATLLAKDGDVVADVVRQLAGLPATATHLVISAGGNDALGHRDLLARDVGNAAVVLGELAAIRSRFASAYRDMLQAVLARRLPTAVCTIYDSNFPLPEKPLADVALTVFNDAILRCAGEAGVPVIDLRRIFRAPADYANAIEPSVAGGSKMVQVIARVVAGHDFAAGRCTLWADRR